MVYNSSLMNSIPTKYIFVDLDEVLIHTSVFWSNKRHPAPEIEILPGWGEFTEGSYRYVAQLRPGAKEMLQRIRTEIAPQERVFMLTTSVADYASHWNKTFDLGFQEHQIYSRRHIEDSGVEGLDPTKFPNAHAYHIDNLPRQCNGGKVRFLRWIDPTPTYIEVSEFIRSPDQDLTAHELEDIMKHLSAPERHDRRFI
jgi:hypothetical protein